MTAQQTKSRSISRSALSPHSPSTDVVLNEPRPSLSKILATRQLAVLLRPIVPLHLLLIGNPYLYLLLTVNSHLYLLVTYDSQHYLLLTNNSHLYPLLTYTSQHHLRFTHNHNLFILTHNLHLFLILVYNHHLPLHLTYPFNPSLPIHNTRQCLSSKHTSFLTVIHRELCLLLPLLAYLTPLLHTTPNHNTKCLHLDPYPYNLSIHPTRCLLNLVP